MKKPVAIVLLTLLSWAPPLTATVHDGRSYTIQAALPQLNLDEDPFVLRQSWWDGELREGERNIVRHQFFKRNAYWFWAGSSDEDAQIAVHVYDSTGKLAESESWQRGHVAATLIAPEKTGSYLIVVEILKAEKKPVERAVVYAYR